MSRSIPITLKEEAPSGLYRAERKVYPREVRGRYDTLRRIAVVVLLGMYYAFPWLSWDGRQAVLFDLPARKFYVFGLVLWPQDFVFLALLLIIAGVALFFFTAVAGRLWCGYACPQTVWTEVFLWMERWTEGDRAKRQRLDAGSWTREKLLRKTAKHLLWLIFALWTGFTFVGFFTPVREFALRLPALDWSGAETFWTVFYALATWGNAGVLRDQVCKYMCPYARFQGAMFDRDTLIIAYDARRGEPRGSRKREVVSVLDGGRGRLSAEEAERWLVHASRHAGGASRALDVRRTTAAYEGTGPLMATPAPAELGDCIDCTWCVQVCPVGIDIRNGLQYECIACGACIDACDQVMDKLGYARGLVRYATQNALEDRPARVLRPRVWIYGFLLAALILGWIVGLVGRAPLTAEVLRDRNALYRVAADGRIENSYSLRIINKRNVERRLRIRLANADTLRLLDDGSISVPPESVQTAALTLVAEPGSVAGRRVVEFVVEDVARGDTAQVRSAFFGPAP
ncbi:MAG: 4Fe-4S binding protein [Rhodanobacteraceae bacterium]|nr:4Fe-4S binding protein [Rhodanobacteraceae bacterium]